MISEITRRNIFDAIRMENVVWAGRLNEPEFLARIFDLEKIPSTDGRFKNAAGDIWQHRINNPTDWDDDWIFSDSRFNLLKCNDETFLRFLCEMIHPVVRNDLQETEKLRQLFNELLAADGYEIVERSRISNYPVYAGRRKVEGIPLGVNLVKNNQVFNAEYLSRQINRIEASILYDPDLAIGTSKELVETCCKTILQERSVEFDNGWDLTKLVKETCKQLKLTPNDIPESAKASETIKRLLSNLAMVTQGLAELRNFYGTGHGKSAKAKGLTPRHAKLAAGAATALAIFLFETHEARDRP
ncbi:MAG: abortive infection family protein [Candidatus Kryptoniota bacterium]